jgi:hypothetical protein
MSEHCSEKDMFSSIKIDFQFSPSYEKYEGLFFIV